MTRADLMKDLEYEIQYMAPGTQSQYRTAVSDYLDFVKSKGDLEAWQTRETLYKYTDYLKKKRHLSQSTINYILRGPIGTLFKMQQPSLHLPIKLPKMSRGRMLDIESRKHFDESEIQKLISAAKASKNPQWLNLMALASVYMMRAGEITGMRKEDIHPLKKTIVIHIEKTGFQGGQPREHLVPSVIAPYIFKYEYPPLPSKKVHTIFKEIAAAAGVDYKGRNIHAIRHGVFTALKNLRDASDKLVYTADDVFRFGRWAGGTITETYNHPQLLENDERIFSHHVFLKYWK